MRLLHQRCRLPSVALAGDALEAVLATGRQSDRLPPAEAEMKQDARGKARDLKYGTPGGTTEQARSSTTPHPTAGPRARAALQSDR
jgi:hypothetical protein